MGKSKQERKSIKERIIDKKVVVFTNDKTGDILLKNNYFA